MFVDEVTINLIAGRGGDGKISFFPKRGGPSGGNGGRGGDIYARVDLQLSSLNKYASVTKLAAEDGRPGEMNRRAGKDGKNLYIDFPLGTTIKDLDSGDEIELNSKDDQVLLCRGGEGGLGNDALKSAINRTPKEAKAGKEGQTLNTKIILRLIADFGLIGLPNAGKSSLLNTLTAAQARIADYPFTTLSPNLGAIDGKIIADIPGLIEGASAGRGLGIKFLKHIEKVSLLLHCISAESTDLEGDFHTVVTEMTNHNPLLLEKKSIILLTKTDLIDSQEITKKINTLKKLNKESMPISIFDEKSLKQLKSILTNKIDENAT